MQLAAVHSLLAGRAQFSRRHVVDGDATGIASAPNQSDLIGRRELIGIGRVGASGVVGAGVLQCAGRSRYGYFEVAAGCILPHLHLGAIVARHKINLFAGLNRTNSGRRAIADIPTLVGYGTDIIDGCIQLSFVDGIRIGRTRSNIGNLVAAVVQSACSQADRIASACCWSDGYAAAVGNGFVTIRIGGGYAGKVRSLFHANRNSRFACRSILGNFSFQITGRSSFCGIACNNGQLFT